MAAGVAPEPTLGMRVLGLDLALGTTGWCVLELLAEETQPRVVGSGEFTLPARRSQAQPYGDWQALRAARLAERLHVLADEHFPDALRVGIGSDTPLCGVAYEYPDYVRRGSGKGRESSAMYGLGLAQGMLVGHWATASFNADETQDACREFPLVAVSTSDAKQGFAGHRSASKERVLAQAQTLYPGVRWTPDAADALAVAWVALLDTARFKGRFR